VASCLVHGRRVEQLGELVERTKAIGIMGLKQDEIREVRRQASYGSGLIGFLNLAAKRLGYCARILTRRSEDATSVGRLVGVSWKKSQINSKATLQSEKWVGGRAYRQVGFGRSVGFDMASFSLLLRYELRVLDCQTKP